MELINPCFFFLLIFLLLATPYFSPGGKCNELVEMEMYEIDYRGPETHTSFPPPTHSRGKPSITRHYSTMGPPHDLHHHHTPSKYVKRIHGRRSFL